MKLLQRWAQLWADQLVDNWRDGWKWLSVHFCVAGIAFNVWAACLLKGITVAVSMVGVVPLAWLPLMALAITVLTLVSRFAKQVPPETTVPIDDETDQAGA